LTTFAKTAAISIFVIEPNNFSPPAFATILISAFKASATACASLTYLALCALCFKFSANTFFADAKCMSLWN
jgi:hypothetical protein